MIKNLRLIKITCIFTITFVNLGCSGVRLQSADELKANLYRNVQRSAREQCYKINNSLEQEECIQSTQEPYDEYNVKRENLSNKSPQ
jgi:hypothetical protein